MSHETYDVHGSGVETLGRGLSAMGVPVSRHSLIIDRVRCVLLANEATGVTWYVVPDGKEIAARWDGCTKNALWVDGSSVHVLPELEFPLTQTATRHWGGKVHHFPWATARAASRGEAQPTTPKLCPLCHNAHGPDDECF
jgi:hypothetical protein